MSFYHKPDQYLRDLVGNDRLDKSTVSDRPADSEFVAEIVREKDNAPSIVSWMLRKALNPRKQEAFLEEMARISTVEHRNFIPPLEFGTTEQFIYTIQPKVIGRRLTEIVGLGQASDQKLRRALGICCDVLEALEKIHELGCLARNVRASNLYLMGNHACLLSASPWEYCDRLNQNDEAAKEHARYAPPEVAGSIQAEIGPAADLYSVGNLLFYLLTGREPFQGTSVSSILYQHVTVDPQLFLTEFEFPKPLVEIIARLLSKDPRGRYQRASAVLHDLRQLQQRLQDGISVDDFVPGCEDVRSNLVPPSFVGRRAELNRLQSLLEGCQQGQHGHSVAITGPVGYGKTRLIEEFIRVNAQRSLAVCRSLAIENSHETARNPILRIIEQVKERAATFEALARRLAVRLKDYRGEISVMFPELAQTLGWEWQGTYTVEDLNRTQFENALVSILANLGDVDHPAVIWIDECHHLDARSLAVIRRLCDSLPKYTLLIFTISSEENGDKEFLETVQVEHKHTLGGLSEVEIEQLLGSAGGRLPETAVNVVKSLAEGSPYMAMAILHGLIEKRAIVFDTNRWRVDSRRLNTIQTSESSVQELVNRLTDMPQSVKQVLYVAATAVNEFDEDQLTEICRTNRAKVDECIAWSRSKRILWQLSSGKYLFVHEKIKESLLAEISPSQRRELHLSFAHYLERFEPDNVAELAVHYHLADAHERALAYALRATAQAQRLQSLEQAEEFLRIAMLGLAHADAITAHEVYSQLADTLMLLGRYDEAAQWLDKTLEYSLPPLELARIKMKIGNLAFKRGDKQSAGQHYISALRDLGYSVPENRFDLGLRLIKELGIQCLHTLLPFLFVGRRREQPDERRRLIWRLHSRVGHAFWYTRDRFYTLWAHLRHLNQAEVYQPTLELAQAYSEHAPAMSLLPWFSRGIKYVKRSLEIRESFQHKWGQGQSRNYYSILLYSTSAYDACIEQATRAVEILNQSGDPWEVHIARYQHAASLLRKGKLKAALELARQTYDSALTIGDFQATVNIMDVWVRAALGDIPEDLLTTEVNREIHDVQGRCQVLLAYGIYHYYRGDYSKAEATFSQAIDLAEKAGLVQAYIAPNYAWRATALRRLLETTPPYSLEKLKSLKSHALYTARKSVDVARRFTNELPHALREYGAALALAGRPREARAKLLKSLAVAQKQGAAFELAQTQQIYGQIGREFNWPHWQEFLETGTTSLREFRQLVARQEKTESLSMLDRFDNLLVAGRQIISENSVQGIYAEITSAAKKLLRGQRTLIVERRQTAEGDYWFSHDAKSNIDTELIAEAVQQNKTIVRDSERYLQADIAVRRHGTYLCSPIVVHNEVIACLYVANEFLTGLYRDDEIRIADYLTATAGGALEKTDGFRRLEELNQGLERIVKERTATIEARSSELEQTAQELMATQVKLEQARDEAERANATKSDFLARMSHEIRTPITAIMGFTELLLRGAVRDPEERTRKLETILNNGTHLLQLINDLLDISKIEADKLEVEMIECNPLKILHEVRSLLAVRAEQHGIELITDIAGPVPSRIISDPTRLKQILINIIGNAIKFTPQGEVKIQVRYQPALDPSQPGGLLEFDVIDSGIGMTPEQLAGLFKPFVQADSSITRKFGGTGLGLAISKRLAEALGGGIRVTSELGKGSIFTIQINPGSLEGVEMITNCRDIGSSANSSPTHGFLRADLRGLCVMIVDDAQTNRDLLSLMLTDAGAQVKTFCNGQEVVDAVRGGLDCGVMLLDMQMPVLDGYSTARELRRLGFTKPIIALTANSMVGDEEKCREAGCTGYLSKPINMNKLFERLGEIVGAQVQSISVKPEPSPSAASGEQMSQAAEEITIDWTQELPDDDIFRSFAEDFVRQVNEQFSDLQEMTQNKKFDELARKAHWIKGTGGTVGLPTMTQIGRELEDATKVRDYDQMLMSLEKLARFIRHQ